GNGPFHRLSITTKKAARNTPGGLLVSLVTVRGYISVPGTT
ncbi:MAG: hypothetical protein ACI814_004985, partial [Mariniblastus sp.]